jgi:uncharacterized protein YmfQ (DUF2313 family)
MAVMTGVDYLQLLQQLLPPGSAWPREPAAVLTSFLTALADELARVDRRGDDLCNEADPLSTWELLPDWERICGLDSGNRPAAERRTALHEQFLSLGGSSLAYFRALATAAGYQVTITEGPEPHVWRLVISDMQVTYFRAGASAAGDRLKDWPVNATIEGLFQRIKPAHTRLIVTYA